MCLWESKLKTAKSKFFQSQKCLGDVIFSCFLFCIVIKPLHFLLVADSCFSTNMASKWWHHSCACCLAYHRHSKFVSQKFWCWNSLCWGRYEHFVFLSPATALTFLGSTALRKDPWRFWLHCHDCNCALMPNVLMFQNSPCWWSCEHCNNNNYFVFLLAATARFDSTIVDNMVIMWHVVSWNELPFYGQISVRLAVNMRYWLPKE